MLPKSFVCSLFPDLCHLTGGAGRDRTDGLLLAKQALSQLSYGPAVVSVTCYPTSDL